MLKESNCQSRVPYPVKISLKNKDIMKTLSTKLRQLPTKRSLKRNPKVYSLHKRKMIPDRKSKMQGQMKYNGEDRHGGKFSLCKKKCFNCV